MTEQYKDAYQNKYREETAQIHAPISLIEKTKAAVREEERRLAVSKTEDANRQKQTRAFSVRKWAYPLTAAAAILILASVSFTMRGLKSVDQMTASDAAYSGAADNGAAAAESAEGAVVTESADAGGFYEEAAAEAPAAEAVEIPMIEEEAPEEAAAEDMTESAAAADAGQTNELLRGDAVADSAAPAEEKSMGKSAENAERKSADKVPQNSTTDAQKKEAAEEELREDGDQNVFTIEKVTKRPDRFNSSEAIIRHYEGKTFRILETTSEGNGAKAAWEAYVEESAGEGYLICGEAENVEDFLEAAWEKLKEGEWRPAGAR